MCGSKAGTKIALLGGNSIGRLLAFSKTRTRAVRVIRCPCALKNRAALAAAAPLGVVQAVSQLPCSGQMQDPRGPSLLKQPPRSLANAAIRSTKANPSISLSPSPSLDPGVDQIIQKYWCHKTNHMVSKSVAMIQTSTLVLLVQFILASPSALPAFSAIRDDDDASTSSLWRNHLASGG
jgi:hypothetical protein